MGKEELLEELEELKRLLRESENERKFRHPTPLEKAKEKLDELIKKVSQ